MNSGDLIESVRRKRFKRRVRQREKLHRRRGGTRRWPAARSKRPPTFARLYAPKAVAIHRSDHRSLTLNFCQKIRQAALHDHLDLILDFSRTTSIESTGMLVTYAEIDRAIRMRSGDFVVRCKLPDRSTAKGMIVGQVLDQIGLLERVGQKPPSEHTGEEFDETVKHWRYATGTRIDTRPGDVLEEHEGRIAPALMTGMQIGLSEAIINSIHHAYAKDRNDGCQPFGEHRWWMFTRELDGWLHVLVCDLGIGIPRSLPLKWDRRLLGKLQALFHDDLSDVAAIKTALVLGETSTDEEHRGKGLPQIWEATMASEGGVVGIFSDKAYLRSTQATGIESVQFADRLLGTLVYWKVPVESAASNDG